MVKWCKTSTEVVSMTSEYPQNGSLWLRFDTRLQKYALRCVLRVNLCVISDACHAQQKYPQDGGQRKKNRWTLGKVIPFLDLENGAMQSTRVTSSYPSIFVCTNLLAFDKPLSYHLGQKIPPFINIIVYVWLLCVTSPMFVPTCLLKTCRQTSKTCFILRPPKSCICPICKAETYEVKVQIQLPFYFVGTKCLWGDKTYSLMLILPAIKLLQCTTTSPM